MDFLSLDGTALMVLEKGTLTSHTRRIRDMNASLECSITTKRSWYLRFTPQDPPGQPGPPVNVQQVFSITYCVLGILEEMVEDIEARS